MASSSSAMHSIDLSPDPDLHPLYPATPQLALLLSSHSGLTPDQKAELVSHCLTRACVFAEFSVLQFLLSDPQAQAYVDLGVRDDDGLGLVSLTIHGFGAESERDVEREECVRLLIAQGADVQPDETGWTPLHYAALLSPPTLVSHLMTRGCSPFAPTRRNLTPLDIVTGHSILPGRDDVALLLEEAMRSQGWTGGKIEENRRVFDERRKRRGKQRNIRSDVSQVLGVNPRWWGGGESEISDNSDSDNEDEDASEDVFTPPVDYSSMLVFSPPELPGIFDSIILHYQPSFRDATPANTLYMLARFACLTCDHTWLEDLIIGAADAIEDAFYSRSEEVTYLVFWLYNTTVLLHLMQCDNSINEACEMLGCFEHLEEVINTVHVFIIRYAERRIDEILDASLLEYSSLGVGTDPVQFESEWSFIRAFSSKKRSQTVQRSTPLPPPPLSPNGMHSPPGSVSKGFSSLRESVSRARTSSSTTPLQSLFPGNGPPNYQAKLLSFLTALHSLLYLSDINPALTAQLWSQVMYWTSCEVFNRVLTRKKYLCRSKAIQINANLNILEDWMLEMGLPRGIQTHFRPVKDLLSWLQCLSSITEFADLVVTIQNMKNINPLQMRRAVRDYKYEVNEGRMTEECSQYLTQLQKDWERHRVKLGVEALRKEMIEREKEREESIGSLPNDSSDTSTLSSVPSAATSEVPSRSDVDLLFEKGEYGDWEPSKPPQVLGELLDSRYMLPLHFPSDPRMLAVLPGKIILPDDEKGLSSAVLVKSPSSTIVPSLGTMRWRSRNKKLREVGVSALRWVDGHASVSRWTRTMPEDDAEYEVVHSSTLQGYREDDINVTDESNETPLTHKPSTRTKINRPSVAEENA